MSQTQQSHHDQSNISADLIAEALAVYTADKGEHARVGMRLARHQNQYENQGVDSKLIRMLFQEAKLKSDERMRLYADELRYRRAVSLWNAESEDDFDRLMEQAQVDPAEGEGATRLVSARAYNDGFNSGSHGSTHPADNKHVPGSLEFQQWARGCKDGQRHATSLGLTTKPKTATTAADDDDEDQAPKKGAAAAPKKAAAKKAATGGKRGRPSKAELEARNADAEANRQPAAEERAGMLDDVA